MCAKRIPRSETQSEAIAKLVRDKQGNDKEKEKNKFFSEYWELLLFSSALGYHLGSSLPLTDADGNDDAESGKAIDQESFKGCSDWPGYIYLLSLVKTNDSDCLNDTEDNDHSRVQIFSEYANGGLDYIRREAYFEYDPLEFAQKLMDLSAEDNGDVNGELRL